MPGLTGRVVPLLTILAALGFYFPLVGDEIRLRSGGEIRGTLETPAGEAESSESAAEEAAPPAEVTVKTLSGARVTIAGTDVELIHRRPPIHEEYVRRAQQVADTVEARWELAEWCRKRKLKEEREEQLERILELDPEHRKAHYGLGHSFLDGAWVAKEDLLRERGLVRYKGKYVSVEQRRVLEEKESIRKEEREWFAKVRLWHIWLKGTDPERSRRGLDELQRINAPEALRALANFLNGDEDPRVRSLYLRVLLNIPGSRAAAMLVQSSLYDADSQIRAEALEGVVKFQPDVARPLYVQQLKNGQNEIVRRAGAALQLVGNAATTPALIEALVTTHQYEVLVPKKNSISFSANGGFARPMNATDLPPSVAAGLLTGQYPNGVIIDNSRLPPPPMQKVTVAREEHNPEVLAALEHLTGESFGYDKDQWRLWWGAQKSGLIPSTSSP